MVAVELTPAHHYVLFCAVDGTPLWALPKGMTFHGRSGYELDEASYDRFGGLVEPE